MGRLPDRFQRYRVQVRPERDRFVTEIQHDPSQKLLPSVGRQNAETLEVVRMGRRRGFDLDADEPTGGILEQQIDFVPRLGPEAKQLRIWRHSIRSG